MRTLSRVLLPLVACAVCLGLMTACGSSAQTAPTGLRSVHLTLNAMAGGQQAGFIYARALGYYADEGLDVRIDESRGSRDATERVADGRSEFGYADPLAIVQARSNGGALTVVSTVFQTAGYAILSLQSRALTRPADLRGRTVGASPRTPARTLLAAVLAANRIEAGEVSVVDIGPPDLVGALRTGRVDATVGTSDFEALQLQNLGEHVVELPYADAGAPLVGLSVVASDALIQRDAQLVEGFVRASLRGWDAARHGHGHGPNSELAARAVIDQFLADYEGQILTQLTSELPLLCGADTDVLGMPSPERWRATLDLYSRYQLVDGPPPIADFVTPRFVDRAAPTCEGEAALGN